MIHHKLSIIVAVVFVTITVKLEMITLLGIRWMKNLSKDTWLVILKQMARTGNHDDNKKDYIAEAD